MNKGLVGVLDELMVEIAALYTSLISKDKGSIGIEEWRLKMVEKKHKAQADIMAWKDKEIKEALVFYKKFENRYKACLPE